MKSLGERIFSRWLQGGFTHLLRLVGEIRAEVVAGIDLHPPPGADTRCEALLRRARLCLRALSRAGSNPTNHFSEAAWSIPATASRESS